MTDFEYVEYLPDPLSAAECQALAARVLDRGLMSTISSELCTDISERWPGAKSVRIVKTVADIMLEGEVLARLRVPMEPVDVGADGYVRSCYGYGVALVSVKQAIGDITGWARQVLHGDASPGAWRASVRRLPRTGLWAGDLHGPAGYHAHTVGAATAEDAAAWLTERARRVLNDPVGAAAIKIDVLDSAPVRAGVVAGE